MAIKFAYYISGHGFGHLIRSLALVRFLILKKIKDFPSDQVYYPPVKNSKEIEFDITIVLNEPAHAAIIERDPFLKHISVECREFDLKIETGLNFSINIASTVDNFRDFVHKSDALIDIEKKFLKENKFDFIITDIGFIPAAAAGLAGIPCYILGNFTWEEVFFDYFQKGCNVYKSDIFFLLDCYNMAEIYFQLPLSLKFRLNTRMQPVGFITRRSKHMGGRIRKMLDMSPEKTYVFDSLDIQGYLDFRLDPSMFDRDISFVVWDRFNKKNNDSKRIMYINEDDCDFEEAVAGCDIILGKPGYNLLSQAIIFNRKVLLADRLDFIETETIISESKRYINLEIIENPDISYFSSERFNSDLRSLSISKKGVRLKPPMFGEIDLYMSLIREIL